MINIKLVRCIDIILALFDRLAVLNLIIHMKYT